jgi:penicillin-binding protein 2
VSDRQIGRSAPVRGRLLFLAAAAVVVFVILAGKLFTLQVVNRREYARRAEQVASRSETIEAPRGRVFDRRVDVPLATNFDSFAVDLVPGEVPADRFDQVLRDVSRLLGVNADDVKTQIRARRERSFEPVMVKSSVPRETLYYLAEHLENYPGVHWRSRPGRDYLGTGSLAHVVGYVANITGEEFQLLYNKGYAFNAVVGKSGIEQLYDEKLRGRDGQRLEIVDVKGQSASDGVTRGVAAEPGKDLVLTIDREIQTLSEKALGKRKGSVIVLRPATGEILGMVSYPYFDPNIFSQGGDKQRFNELALDPESPFLNRAVQSAYPPASVFKLVLTTAIVEEDLFPKERTVYCPGSMRLGDRLFNCWKKSGHGPLDLIDALAQSCDVYFWTVGLEAVGVERILRYAEMYGFGKPSGIDLSREAAGFMASPRWKEQKLHAPWVGGDTLNLSIGQGWTLVTPLQVANMVAMIVNEGTVYKPHVVKEVRDATTGGVVERRDPEVLRTSSVKPETFRFVQEAMREVVKSGTAQYVLSTRAVEAAAKTGTGEVGLDEAWHSWFVTYAPYKTANPLERVVVVVMVEAGEGEYEWWAPKAGNAILQGIFAHQTFEEAARALGLSYLTENR